MTGSESEKLHEEHAWGWTYQALTGSFEKLDATLAKMARDPNLAADARTEALSMLARANEQLPPASDKRH